MIKALHVFLVVWLGALIVHGVVFKHAAIPDKDIWTAQVQYVDQHDPRAFDAEYAYGYPGTPYLETAIIAHRLVDLPYAQALQGSLALFTSAAIAGIAVTLYTLSGHHVWWLVASGILIFNRLLPLSIPPTAVASYLVVLLFLLSWRLYREKTNASVWLMMAWGVCAGLATATRADISVLVITALLIPLSFSLPWRMIIPMLVILIFVFTLTNPFMWSSPIQHLQDIYNKIIWHASSFQQRSLSPLQVLFISPLALTSLLVAAVYVVFKKDPALPLPSTMLIVALLLTLVTAGLLLTSRFQVPRYVYPIVFLWEALLPVLVLSPTIRWRSASLALGTLLVAGQAILLYHLVAFPQVIIVCGALSLKLSFYCANQIFSIVW